MARVPDDLRDGYLTALRLRAFVTIVAIGTLAFLGTTGCALLPRHAARFRMAIALNVMGKVINESSIIQVAFRFNKSPFGTPDFQSLICGRAIIFDLGARGHLVATLQPDYTIRGTSVGVEEIALRAFSTLSKRPYHGYAPESARREMSKFRGRVELPSNLLPQFVWLPQPDNVASAVNVEPDAFGTTIGSDVSLRSVSLETTSLPTNGRIEPAPVWLDQMRHGLQPDRHGPVFRLSPFNLERRDCRD
jgi:hypothetical protein